MINDKVNATNGVWDCGMPPKGETKKKNCFKNALRNRNLNFFRIEIVQIFYVRKLFEYQKIDHPHNGLTVSVFTITIRTITITTNLHLLVVF